MASRDLSKGKSAPAWATTEELNFIAGLRSRKALEGYLTAASKRADWGAIDPAVVIGAAKTRLAYLVSGS